MIIKDKLSESEALFNAEVKIVCFTLVSVTVDYSRSTSAVSLLLKS